MKRLLTFFCILVTIMVIFIFVWLCVEDKEAQLTKQSEIILYENVYIMEAFEDGISFYDGELHEAKFAEYSLSEIIDISGNQAMSSNLDTSGNQDISSNLDTSGNRDMSSNLDISGNQDVSGNTFYKLPKGLIVDLYLRENKIEKLVIKTKERINGKVVALTEDYVEIENKGRYAFSKDCVFYKIYGEPEKENKEDICIGYDFSDFVIYQGEIIAVLHRSNQLQNKVRILIKNDDFKSYFHDTVKITCDTDYLIKFEKDGELREILHKAGEEVCLVENGSFLEEYQNRVSVIPVYKEGYIRILSLNRAQGNPTYHGNIEIHNFENDICIINEVDMEEYLYQVVLSEMPASYPLEALKAQAICARTYAYYHLLHPGLLKYGAHMDDSTSYQVYGNTLLNEKGNRAVDETNGMILQDGDEILTTYYYSTSCGISSDERVFLPGSEDLDIHLISQRISLSSDTSEPDFATFFKERDEDAFEKDEPWYRWTIIIDFKDGEALLKRLQDRYKNNPEHILKKTEEEYLSQKVEKLGKIKNITVLKRGVGGVIEELLIEGDEATYKVISQSDIRYVLCEENTVVKRQDESTYTCKNLLPSAYFVIEKENEGMDDSVFVLFGGGFGHGAGLSQNAAKNMAEAGYMAGDILSFFYKNCEIKKVNLP